MKTFKELLLEVRPERSPERAIKLLDYMVKKPKYHNGSFDDTTPTGDKVTVNLLKPPIKLRNPVQPGKKKIGLMDIPLNKITTDQDVIDPEEVKRKLNGITAKKHNSKPDDPINVTKTKTGWHLHNGSHRTTKDKLLRKQTIKAEVWE